VARGSAFGLQRGHRPALIGLFVAGLLLAGDGAARASLSPTPQGWPQTNGRVKAIATAGGLTYIGGTFTTVTPVGGVAQPAGGLAAFTSTGGLAFTANFGPSGTAEVDALTVSGGVLYVGGSFSTVNGRFQRNLVAFNSTTGSVLGFSPGPNFAVEALTSTSSTVYIGGAFTRSSGQGRAHLAAYTHTAPQDWALTSWNPGTSGEVKALLVVPRGLLVGGTFRMVSGTSHTNLALVSLTTGVALPWLSDSPYADVLALARSGNLVVAGLGGAGGSATGYLETTGTQLWKVWTDGNVAAIAIADGEAIIGGHFRNYCPDGLTTSTQYPGYVCANSDSIERDHLAALDLTTGQLDPNWAPVLDSVLGVFAELGSPISPGSPQTVGAGGDFTQTGGGASAVPTAHLVQFGPSPSSTAPTTLQAPQAAIALDSQLSPNTVPVQVSYLAGDDTSGICGYALSQTPNAPGYPLWLPWANAEWATAWIEPNHTIPTTFGVTPTDCSGNVGTETSGAPVALNAYVQAGIRFAGHWQIAPSPSAFRGVYATTHQVGASASLTFTGTEIAYAADRGGWDQVAVYIDGQYIKTLNLYSRTSDPRQVLFTDTWPTAGTHTIRIVLVKSGTSSRINLDRFLVLSSPAGG